VVKVIKFYLAFSIRGGQIPEANAILGIVLEILKRYGQVLNERIVIKKLNDKGEDNLPDEEICTMAINMINEADILVIVYCGHSFGAGFETGYWVGKGRAQKIIGLVSQDDCNEKNASALFLGNPHIEKLLYDCPGNVESLLIDLFKRMDLHPIPVFFIVFYPQKWFDFKLILR